LTQGLASQDALPGGDRSVFSSQAWLLEIEKLKTSIVTIKNHSEMFSVFLEICFVGEWFRLL
jgi:hypothetical protein